MAQQGAALQTYNVELVKCKECYACNDSKVDCTDDAALACFGIEDLKNNRAELQISIERDENEKAVLQSDIEKLSYRLNQINNNLSKKIAARNDYERTISETEAAYSKILESSQVLLNMARREAVSLEQAVNKKTLSVPGNNEIM